MTFRFFELRLARSPVPRTQAHPLRTHKGRTFPAHGLIADLRSQPVDEATVHSRGSAVDDKVAYSVQEAAQALSLGTSTVKKLIASDELASVRVGRRRLIPRSALTDYLHRLAQEQRSA